MATYAELFAGIGGLSKALEMLGHSPAWFAEWDKDAAKELARKYPGVPIYGDVSTIDYAKVEPVEILVGGGWPCQGFSGAGKRLGIDDPRYQWPQVMRALRHLRPRIFLFEQVADILRPWPVYDGEGDDKRLLGYRHPPIARVLADLSAAGYVGRYGCLRSSDVGAPHGRQRLFLVAYAGGERGERRRGSGDLAQKSERAQSEARQRQRCGDALDDHGAVASHSNHERRNRQAVHARPGRPEPGEAGDPGHRGTPGDPDSAQREGISRGGYQQRDLAREVQSLADSHGARPEGDRRPEPHGRSFAAAGDSFDWRIGDKDFGPAIRRWETIVGPAPVPYVMLPDREGNPKPRLNPVFSAWMMALEPPELPRRAALRCIGNAVNPLQAFVALTQLERAA